MSSLTTEDVQIIWTVVAFVFFVGVVFWALSSKRKSNFDKAARMALDDDNPVADEQRRDS